MSFQKIILPTDFSQNAERAFEAASNLAEALSATLILVHVTPLQYDRVNYGNLGKESRSDMDIQINNYVLKQLDELRRKFPESMTVECAHREGEPDVQLIQAAEDLGADLIVVASHGFTGSRYHVLGSIAEKLVRSAPCPVMTIRALD